MFKTKLVQVERILFQDLLHKHFLVSILNQVLLLQGLVVFIVKRYCLSDGIVICNEAVIEAFIFQNVLYLFNICLRHCETVLLDDCKDLLDDRESTLHITHVGLEIVIIKPVDRVSRDDLLDDDGSLLVIDRLRDFRESKPLIFLF